MWEDTAFTAGDEKAVALLAAVRKASPATTLDAANNAPFVAPSRLGPLAFSLNGHAFHDVVRGAGARRAPARARPSPATPTPRCSSRSTRERIDAGHGRRPTRSPRCTT